MKLRSLCLYLVVASLLLVSPLYSQTRDNPPGPHEAYGGQAEIIKYDIPYVEGKEKNKKLMLDVYSNPHEGLWPVVVMIHGGAWTKGDKSMSNKVYNCKVLAKNGYVVFNINYRLYPPTMMKKQAEDAMAAVIWVKKHAAEYGGDSERIGVIGGSAGGHLAALVAWGSDDPWFSPTGYSAGVVDSDVVVAALYYPVIDVRRTFKEVTNIFAPTAEALLIGVPSKKKLEHLSPKNHIDANIPPTIFLTGDADSLHLYPHSVEYCDKLKELGVDTKLYTATGKDHGFTWQYWDPESVESAHEVVYFFDKYLK